MELRIRNVDDWIVETFRSLAKMNGRSMEAEVKAVLRERAMHPREALAKELTDLTDKLRREYGVFSDSAAIIRENRESRE
jgi:plasmid stability protein